jgi:drug/metabolite transporter (DMT)-like permease
MQRTSLAVAVLTHYLAPLLVAMAAPVFLGERLGRTTLVALAVSLAGLALLLEPWRPGAGGDLAGALWGAGSAVFYAANVLLGKALAPHFTPRQTVGWHMAPAVALLWCFVPPGGLAVGAAPLAILAAGALVAGVGANLLFFRGLAVVEAGRASVLTLLEPLVAVAIGWFVWGEVPGPLAGAGAALLLTGAYLVIRRGP